MSADGVDKLKKVDDPALKSFQPNGSATILPTDEHFEAWVAGGGGSIAHLEKDGQWKVNKITNSDDHSTEITSISALSDKDLWAVGTNGFLAHFDSQTWSIVPRLTNKALWRVSFFSNGFGVIVGDRGTLLLKRPEEKTWAPQDFETGDSDNVRLLTTWTDPARELTTTDPIVLGGVTNKEEEGIIVVGERVADGKINWTKAKIVDSGKPVGAIRAIERFGYSQSFVAVGDHSTILVSHDSAKSWKVIDTSHLASWVSAKNKAGDADLAYALSVSTNKAILTGAFNTIATLSLNVNGAEAITLEHFDPDSKAKISALVLAGTRQYALSEGVLESYAIANPLLKELSSFTSTGLVSLLSEQGNEHDYTAGLPDQSDEKAIIHESFLSLKSTAKVIEKIDLNKSNLKDDEFGLVGKNRIDGSQLVLWATGVRAFLVIVIFFALRHLMNLVRFNFNFSAYYDTKADAIRAMLLIPGSVAELGGWFTPTMLDDIGGGWSDSFASIFKSASPKD